MDVAGADPEEVKVLISWVDGAISLQWRYTEASWN